MLGGGGGRRKGVGMVSHTCDTCGMTDVASRELRNNTRDLIMRAAGGEEIVITIDGIPMAELRAIQPRTTWMAKEAFMRNVLPFQADAGLTQDLRDLLGDETTDDIKDPWA